LITSSIAGRHEPTWDAPWQSLALPSSGALRPRRTEASRTALDDKAASKNIVRPRVVQTSFGWT
jgi:hypothetical protein